MKLYCFPWAGGSSVIFDFWKNTTLFNPITIEYAGHGRRYIQELKTDFSEIVLDAVGQILDSETTDPICLFGHSMGALVAFEAAHNLREAGINVHHLFVSGMCAPKIWHKKTKGIRRENNIIDAVKGLNGIPSEVLNNPDILKVFLPIIQADYDALDTYHYRHERALESPITVFSGIEDIEMYCNKNEWSEETSAACSFYNYNSGHFFIKEQHRQVINTMHEEIHKTSSESTVDDFERICF